APDFFDLIVIDECHRGSASEDSAWREILDYFSAATQIGLTATPKETHEVSSTDYFGDPVYIYSLKEGIEDGFLAPYKVVRVDIDVDLQGWRPTKGQTDKNGELIDDRIYNQKDFDRTMVIDERTELVAKTITDYLKRTNPMDKTIIFCNDIDHAERMRRALVNLNPEQVKKNDKYVMKITGDDDIGKAQLDNFINPKKAYPVIATTSELMTTGVDAKTCKLVVLDQNIQSMTKFKQIIGRGTRIDERYGKLWFTILDFKKATELFADERFDGIPEKVMDTTPEDIADPDSDFEEQFDEHEEETK
ncbi:DEAD/DEAH box helicase family protein, partial [Salmonella enterica subsp. enterica serovar Agona]|nr:DEAD/DEAH box helicase family protein [Salmonella enterica subsp. enterica serovar Agona]